MPSEKSQATACTPASANGSRRRPGAGGQVEQALARAGRRGPAPRPGATGGPAPGTARRWSGRTWRPPRRTSRPPRAVASPGSRGACVHGRRRPGEPRARVAPTLRSMSISIREAPAGAPLVARTVPLADPGPLLALLPADGCAGVGAPRRGAGRVGQRDPGAHRWLGPVRRRRGRLGRAHPARGGPRRGRPARHRAGRVRLVRLLAALRGRRRPRRPRGRRRTPRRTVVGDHGRRGCRPAQAPDAGAAAPPAGAR